MLDLIKQTITGVPNREMKVHTIREFLQLLILKIVADEGYFKNLAFVGGTALRLIYGLRRFSEDLDFSLINKQGYKFDRFLERVTHELEKYGLAVEIKRGAKGPVQSAMVKFKDILYPLELSPQKNQRVAIKLEIDSNPPPDWNTEFSLVNRHFVFAVLHFDIPSLYATKIHAGFFRKYIKGRDFYDLIWYLGKRVMPNFELLNNAIAQTEKEKMELNADNFNDFLKERLARIDFTKVRKDVERFVEDKHELKLLDRDMILKLLDKKGLS